MFMIRQQGENLIVSFHPVSLIELGFFRLDEQIALPNPLDGAAPQFIAHRVFLDADRSS